MPQTEKPKVPPIRMDGREVRYITLTSLSAVPQPMLAAAGLSEAADPLAGSRKDIENVLRLLARDVPTLTPAKPDLLRLAADAVAGLQGGIFPQDGVRKLSVGGTLAKFGSRGPFHTADAVRRFVTDVHDRLATPLADSLIAHLDRHLIAAIGAEGSREIGRMVRKAHASRLLAPDTEPLDALAHIVWRSYHECLRLQLGLASTKHPLVATISRFTELFCCGNIPAGTLDDGSFLVLVA